MDLNSDIGEGYGAYKITSDEAIINMISSANIACGFHAGDANVMDQTVKLAKEKNVGIGAHPGFPDLMGFGRRMIHMESEEIYRMVAYQIGALQSFCLINGVSMQHVKPHGALYNLAAKDTEIAHAIATAIYDIDKNLILYGLAGSKLLTMGKKAGLKTASEVFADRTYQSDGTLTPRTSTNAVISNDAEAVKQVLQMITEGTVTATDGTKVPVQADTICVHGDGEHAIQFASRLKVELEQAGIQLKRIGDTNDEK